MTYSAYKESNYIPFDEAEAAEQDLLHSFALIPF
jgi:hypothetical protein